MAEPQIVSCPGCGKRYSVPPGVPPGQFQCQDCSAVVVYGRKGDSGPGPRGHGAGGAKHAARAAAARRKIHDRRGEEDEDEGGRRRPGEPVRGRKQANPMLYVAAFLVVVLLGVGGFLLVRTSRTEEKPVAAAPKKGAPGAKGAPGGDEETKAPAPAPPEARAPEPPMPSPAPAPSPSPAAGESGGGLRVESRKTGAAAESEKFEPAANPPTGGNYDKTEAALRSMLKNDRASVLTPLEHLPDTPQDLRSKIDEDVARIADPMAGREALDAHRRLVKMGRPVIPRVLGAAAKYDFSKYKNMDEARDACVVADAVDGILREVTSNEKFARLQYTREGHLDQYQKTMEDWYVWWLCRGHKAASFPKKAAEDE